LFSAVALTAPGGHFCAQHGHYVAHQCTFDAAALELSKAAEEGRNVPLAPQKLSYI
jgi:hypothetical protein